MAIKVKGLPQYGKQKVEISKDVSPEMIDPNVAVQSIKAQGQAKADTIISKGQAVQAITGAVGKIALDINEARDSSRFATMSADLERATVTYEEGLEKIKEEAVINSDFNVDEAIKDFQTKFKEKWNDDTFKSYGISLLNSRSAKIQYDKWSEEQDLKFNNYGDKLQIDRMNLHFFKGVEDGYSGILGKYFYTEPFNFNGRTYNQGDTFDSIEDQIEVNARLLYAKGGITANKLGEILSKYPIKLAEEGIKLRINNFRKAYQNETQTLPQLYQMAEDINNEIRANPHLAQNRNSYITNFSNEFNNFGIYTKQKTDKAFFDLYRAIEDGDVSQKEMDVFFEKNSFIGQEAQLKIMKNAFLSQISTHEDYEKINEALKNLIDTPMAFDEFVTTISEYAVGYTELAQRLGYLICSQAGDDTRINFTKINQDFKRVNDNVQNNDPNKRTKKRGTQHTRTIEEMSVPYKGRIKDISLEIMQQIDRMPIEDLDVDDVKNIYGKYDIAMESLVEFFYKEIERDKKYTNEEIDNFLKTDKSLKDFNFAILDIQQTFKPVEKSVEQQKLDAYMAGEQILVDQKMVDAFPDLAPNLGKTIEKPLLGDN